MSDLHKDSDGNQKSKGLVWDGPLRVFHWLLLLDVFILAMTGFFGDAEAQKLHIPAGFFLILLLVFRLIWGLLGTRYSRYSSYKISPRLAFKHMQGLIKGKNTDYTAHNPAGTGMIVALMTVLILMGLSGLSVLGGIENRGPLQAFINFAKAREIKEIHETLAFILVGLIAIHILAILYEKIRFKNNLVKSMIHGQKELQGNDKAIQGSYWLKGLGIFIATSAISLFIGFHGSNLKGGGWHPIETGWNEYRQACGECHMLYHPSLHLAKDWQDIMNNLENHYGENASMKEDAKLAITDWLIANDASHFDTKVSNLIANADMEGGLISSTKFWKRKHEEINDEVFKDKAIQSKSNCLACHEDAELGRFNSAKIEIPKLNQ